MLGRLERYSSVRHDLIFYLGPAVTASYELPKNGPLPLKECIYQACRHVIAQHPMLSAISVDEHTQSPYFVRLPKIDLDKCVVFLARQHDIPGGAETRDAELDERLSSQHSKPYEAPNPFWRLCILHHANYFTAAFFYHHAIGDGQSGIAFHRSFHQALCSAVTTSVASAAPDFVDPILVPTPSMPLLPSLESLHPLPVTIWYLLTVLFRELILSKIWSSRDPGLWCGGKCAAPLGQTRVRSLALSASATLAFKNACRTNGTTITAAL